MADFGSPVAVNVNVDPNRQVQTISGILGIRQQQQALQGQAAEVQMAQQSARQRAGIAAFMQNFDPTKHEGPDGTLDLDSVLTDPQMRRAAGDQFPELVQSMIQIKQGQLNNKQALANLNNNVRGQFMDIVGSLRTDSDVIADNAEGRKKVERAMGEFAATGPDAARIANLYGGMVEHAPQGKLAQAVSSAQLQGMAASAQAAAQAPQYMGVGAGAVNINPQAAGGNLGNTPDMRMGITPAYGVDPLTHTPLAMPGTMGGPQGAPPPQISAPARQRTAAPSQTSTVPGAAPGLPHYAPGEIETVGKQTASGGERYQNLVNAASGVRDRVNVLDNIIRIAGDPAAPRTGPGSGWKAAAATVAGQIPGWAGAKDDAAKYNELLKFMHQNALRTWQAAGGTGTNQQLSTIEGANPNVTQDPTTIVELAKFNKAGELALQAKATAHTAWMHEPGNNFANQDKFETEWRNNVDPVAFQLKTWNAQEALQRLHSMSQEQRNRLAQSQAYLKSLGVY